MTTDACQRSLIKMGFCVLICCCAWATQLGLFTGSIKALTISNCPCRVWNLKARRLKAKIATKPVSKVQLCGCCDVQSGWKFISEVAGNLSPIQYIKYQPVPPSTIKYQAEPPFTDPVPSSTNQYCPLLTQHHQVPTSTALY